MESNSLKNYFFLHLIFFLYSLGGICSKTAAKQKLFSFQFLFFYGLVLLILFCYAVVWQQILKRIPLTIAFSNKGVVIVWNLIWGILFFQEKLTIFMIIGVILILVGIYFVVARNEE